MRASVFVGTSLDGFIARANGDFDFLDEGGGEPHGYDEFMATVDALVIGRKTFETISSSCSVPVPSLRRLPKRLLNICRGSQLKSGRSLPPAASSTFMWTGESPFKGFFGRDWFSG